MNSEQMMIMSILIHLNHKLDTICEALDVKLKHHHNALEDAIAAGECYIKIKDMIKEKASK